jgi:glycosyltransferase involved in cell wall biosynthesis
MEAISQGIPVISPKVGGMEDLIVDGVNGFLYDADDFQSLVSKVKHLVQTPGELARLQESTRDTLLPKEFRFEEMLQAYEHLFAGKT